MDISTGSWFKYLREEVLTEGLRDIGLPERIVDFIENAMPNAPEKAKTYAGNQWKDHALHQVAGTSKDRAKKLRELAAAGDELALELFDDQATALGIALLMIQYIGDYDELVIGGGVCDMTPKMRDRYLATVKAAFFQRALNGFRSFDSITFSHCGDQASVIGAYVDALVQTGAGSCV